MVEKVEGIHNNSGPGSYDTPHARNRFRKSILSCVRDGSSEQVSFTTERPPSFLAKSWNLLGSSVL